ncbi:hypothetical protein MMC13_008389 [Lambiella insularis]|nr:hypothetical protein [Lambiella insularis]
MTPPIAVYSLPDLKNTTDDALPIYLTSLDFQQSHLLTDVRLTLGYSAVVIAAITFYFDYKLGWDETKEYTFWAVIAYFALNGALTLWIFLAERGTIFRGSNKNGTLLIIASSMTKHTPVYKLTVRWTDPEPSASLHWDFREISAPFTTWFSIDGHFIAKPFQQWLAAEVPVVRKADGARLGKSIERGAGAESTSSRDQGCDSMASTRSRKGKK